MRKKFIDKLIVFSITSIMILTSLPVSYARVMEDKSTVKVDTIAKVAVGETVEVPISINNPLGTVSYQLNLSYDSKEVEPVLIQNKENKLVPDVLLEDKESTIFTNIDSNKSLIKIAVAGSKEINIDRTLLTVKFKVKVKGVSPLEIKEILLKNNKGYTIPCNIINGRIVSISNDPSEPNKIKTDVQIDSINGNVGDTVEIPVSIKNPLGLTAYQLNIAYDSKEVEPIIVEGKLDIILKDAEGIMSTNLDSENNLIKIAVVNKTEITNDTTLFKIKFKLKEKGVSPLGINQILLKDKYGYTIACNKVDGKIIVTTNGSIEPSDPTEPSKIKTSILVKNESGNVGDIIQVPVSIESPLGLMAYQLNIAYDSNLVEPILVEGKPDIILEDAEGIVSTNEDRKNNLIKIAVANKKEITNDTILFRIKFKLKETGASPIEIKQILLKDKFGYTIPCNIENGATQSTNRNKHNNDNNSNTTTTTPIINSNGNVVPKDLIKITKGTDNKDIVKVEKGAISSAMKQASLSKKNIVHIELPEVAKNMSVLMNADEIKTLTENNVILNIKSKNIEYSISANVLDKVTLDSFGKGVYVELGYNEIKQSEYLKNIKIPENMKPTNIIDLSLDIVDSNGNKLGSVASFNEPIEIKINIKDMNVDLDKSGFYYINKNTGTVEFISGKVKDGILIAKLNHYSEYAVIESNITYKDIQQHWSKKYVESMSAKNIVTGYPGQIYDPERNVTRAEFATLIVKALELKIVKFNNNFNDINDSDWHANFVATASANKIIRGYEDGSFSPNKEITRLEMAVMINNALKNLDVEINKESISNVFSDSEFISSWGKASVEKTYKLGIISGMDGKFNPDGKTTRAQAATAIYKLFNK